MKQEDARGAHTGSCKSGDGWSRHYGISGHLRPQSKCIILTTFVKNQKFASENEISFCLRKNPNYSYGFSK